MKSARIAFLLCAAWCALRLVAAPEPQELAPDLSYLRAASLGETLPALASPALAERTLVLDLRYTSTTDDDAAALARLIADRKPGQPRWFLLVSPATPLTLATALSHPPAGIVTLGIQDSQPAPMLVVAQPAEVDRRAYDAWSESMPLATLLTGKIGKERYDEASLVREFENGVAAPAPPPAPDPTGKPASETVPVLTDRVLQRAVHLHRALQALRPRLR